MDDRTQGSISLRYAKLAPGEIRYYKDEGFVLLPGLVSAADALAMRDEVLAILHAQGTPLDRLRRALAPGDKLLQTGQYLRESRLDAYINSPVLRGIAAQLLGGDCSLYMPFSAVKNGGGGGQFHFHQDNQYTRFEDGLGGINIWLALNEMTPDNGALQVVPKSHLRGTLDSVGSGDGDKHRKVQTDPEHFLPIRMSPGDAVAFTRLTVHGSGTNITAEPRIAYAVQFHRDDVMATWDNQPPRLLKGSNRWPVGPVDQITPPESKGRDGH